MSGSSLRSSQPTQFFWRVEPVGRQVALASSAQRVGPAALAVAHSSSSAAAHGTSRPQVAFRSMEVRGGPEAIAEPAVAAVAVVEALREPVSFFTIPTRRIRVRSRLLAAPVARGDQEVTR